MKKIILILLLIVICGCGSKKIENKPKEKKKVSEQTQKVETYQDDNNTPIGLYFLKGNKLELITDYQTDIETDKDIGVFQIYPSNDPEIILTNDFGSSFFDTWQSQELYPNLKIGFNIKYTLDNIETGEKVNHLILDPATTLKTGYEFIIAFLYDDYLNRYSNFYSHIEQNEYNDESLFTSIKLYCSHPDRIVSKITLTVFTYDNIEDIENDEYRGNSSYTITICDTDKTCY